MACAWARERAMARALTPATARVKPASCGCTRCWAAGRTEHVTQRGPEHKKTWCARLRLGLLGVAGESCGVALGDRSDAPRVGRSGVRGHSPKETRPEGPCVAGLACLCSRVSRGLSGPTVLGGMPSFTFHAEDIEFRKAASHSISPRRAVREFSGLQPAILTQSIKSFFECKRQRQGPLLRALASFRSRRSGDLLPAEQLLRSFTDAGRPRSAPIGQPLLLTAF